MDKIKKEEFLKKWSEYFPNANLPIVFYYTNEDRNHMKIKHNATHRCVFIDIMKALKGKTIVFDKESTGCMGGKIYFGFSKEIMPDFEYFLSCGKKGLEGERYKKTPELVREFMKNMPTFDAPGRYIIFKRIDMLEDGEVPEAVIFFDFPDVISGLFTLANFDRAEDNVRVPFGSGCSSIVFYPYLEKFSRDPKCILGSFDVSARPYMRKDYMSFSIPFQRFVQMLENMDESFLITKSWEEIKKRIRGKEVL
ncbi:MAG: DUF169 domain-containing protein [Deltaproteobacteria bacterium]|nr:DUF169 domain-containing protein [Deltaproteobacteria bacterium]